jgi:hypothetical protein
VNTICVAVEPFVPSLGAGNSTVCRLFPGMVVGGFASLVLLIALLVGCVAGAWWMLTHTPGPAPAADVAPEPEQAAPG